MNEILNHFQTENEISAESITAIQNDCALRVALIDYSRQNKNRQFALALVNQFITIRKQPDGFMPAEDLMLACFNLGLQNEIEDCLKIWEVKNIDFDTYCGIDIQLLPFSGLEQTITFLKQQTGLTAEKALAYVIQSAASEDFDDLSDYFSSESYPWFL